MCIASRDSNAFAIYLADFIAVERFRFDFFQNFLKNRQLNFFPVKSREPRDLVNFFPQRKKYWSQMNDLQRSTKLEFAEVAGHAITAFS